MNRFWFLLVAACFILACDDETFYPSGLYNYQVERLITDGGGQATWLITSISIDGQNQSMDGCLDSVRWVFERITTDSISAYMLEFDVECVLYDTTLLGQMTASGNDLLFTDSLLFETVNSSNDRVMHVSKITSTELDVSYRLSSEEYKVRLNKVTSSLLTKQASSFLTGGFSAGDEATWKASTETIDGVLTSDLDTCTNVKFFRFERQPQDVISVFQIIANEDCSLQDLALGQASLGDSSSYFTNQALVSGTITSQIDFTSITNAEIEVTYVIQDTVLVEATYFKQ